MRICPKCRARYDASVRQCPTDDRRLVTLAAFAGGGGDALLGRTLAGRYTVLSKLGAGNMGTVYRAEQAPLNREVAFKVLRKDVGRDPESMTRFEREAVMLSQLKHPNTVTVLDAGRTEDGQLFLAMELLEGEMLSTRLKRVGFLGVDESIRVTMGVLRSLDEAHAKGIIHRDLKPDNIFLAQVHGRPDEAEVVKVVDFGIAKIRDGERPHGLDPLKTAEGTVFGTPRYMSPEQAQGKALDGRSDLYAVGLLLFHMLSGDPPFLEDDAVVVMAHHIKTVPPRLRDAAPAREVPEDLDALVARGLAKDPALRPQTAQEFLALLETVRDNRRATPAPGVVPPATSTFPPTAPVAPRRSWAQVSAVAATVTLGLLGLSRLTADPAPAPRAAVSRVPGLSAPRVLPPAPPAATPVAAPPIAPAPPPAESAGDTLVILEPEPESTASRPQRRHRRRRHRVENIAQGDSEPATPRVSAPSVAPTRSASAYDRWND
jgi:eukaryotic-like serine/threonine-protein kinase